LSVRIARIGNGIEQSETEPEQEGGEMSRATSKQKPKPYKRSGKAVAGGDYVYPKRWEIRIEPDTDGVVRVRRVNENFNAYELYGHLRMALLDIERQLSYSTSESSTTELLEKQEADTTT
jgi:hypothetical protein